MEQKLAELCELEDKNSLNQNTHSILTTAWVNLLWKVSFKH